MEYDGKKFVNVSEENLDLDTEEEKKEIKKINDENKEMLNSMKEIIGSDISDVRFTHRLKNHPVCDKEKFNEYTKILYSQSRLIEGLSIENPTEISNLICDLLSK